jgi:hypothetical protein
MEVFYIPWIRQWYSILRSEADASRTADPCYPEGTLPAGGKFVCAFTGEYAPEH